MPNIIVIGASAGGVDPLRAIIGPLPADLQAAIFVVMHISPWSPTVLPNILGLAARMRVSAAEEGRPIEPSNVYVAQPDLHLLVEPGYIHLTRDPRENRHRPAIDPLFRSAARSYGSRVLGIILTGMLNDGAQGLSIIKAEGGTTIVQDPEDALFESMPRNAIEASDVDYILKPVQIPQLIMKLVRCPWKTTDVA